MDNQKVEALAVAGKEAADLHKKIAKIIKPGLSLLEIEALAKDTIKRAGMQPAFLGFNGYPAVTCISVNNEIVHGIPTNYILREGDVVSVDLGIASDGWIVDTARTHLVGRVDPVLKKLRDVAEEALQEALRVARAGNTTGDIGAAVNNYVTKNGFFVVKDLTGHGVSQKLQDEPSIPNYGTPGRGVRLEKDMVLAIEPIITDKPCHIGIAPDGWTILSDNGAIGVHSEDTVIITDDEPIVLTR